MNNPTIHHGIVLSSSGDTLTVKLTDADSCNTCAARALCHTENSDGKVTVTAPNANRYQAGEHVKVRIAHSAQSAAIWLTIAIPCTVLLVVTGAVFVFGRSQGWAALAGIGSVGLYYAILYAARGHLRRRWKWELID